ncbi:MAG TPA: TlpA disulfide reductase family protein [Actinomycetota bacterium]|nr:TlpA disulfide reductase family protein [Actinomycetota bacterium]
MSDAVGGDPIPEPPAPRKPWVALVATLLVVAAVVAVVVVLHAQKVTPFLPAAERDCGAAKALIAPGGTLPMDCEVKDLASNHVMTLAQYSAGKPMVINFWASWCESCIQEMPGLQQVYKAAAGQVSFLGLDLLGVQGEIASYATQFAHQRAVTYPLAYDDNALLYSRVVLRFLPPTTVFVKPDGTMVEAHIGELTPEELRTLIATDLGVKVAA